MTDNKIKRNYMLCGIIVTALRILLGECMGVWYPAAQYYDDALLIRYSNLHDHFVGHSMPANDWLCKDMSFPLFLRVVWRSGLTYSFWLTMLWIVSALLLIKIASMILSDDKKYMPLYLGIYFYALFTPAAFDLWTGTRLYRNALMTPCYIIEFALLVIIFLNVLQYTKDGKYKVIYIADVLFFGFVFTFTYYIKEDGVWTLGCYISVLILGLIVYFTRILKNKKRINVKFLILLFVPLLLFAAGTKAYKMINYKYFGVELTNSRTEGEIAEFINNIYKIDSADRTDSIWAPMDAVEQAFAASPTLAKYDDTLGQIFRSYYTGASIYGEHINWVIRNATYDAGLWTSEKDVQKFYAQVNKELDAAFKSGILKEDKKFRLLSSTGGRSKSEILDLVPVIFTEYKIHLVMEYYVPGGMLNFEYDDNMSEYAGEITNLDLRAASYGDAQLVREREIKKINSIIKVIFIINKLIQPILFITSVGTTFYILIMFVYKWKKKRLTDKDNDLALMALLCFGMLAVSIVYALAVAWFTSFITYMDGKESMYIALKFYSIGLVSLFEIINTVSISVLIKNIKAPKTQVK